MNHSFFQSKYFKMSKNIFFTLFFFGGAASFVYASVVTNFSQTINSGTLSVGIVDGSYATVPSPSVSMSATTVSFNCETSTGTFGTASQQIYVSNPDAADNGWVVSLAATSPSATWSSTLPAFFDFNDPTSSGCTDGGDTDSLGGQMTVNPSGGTLAIGNCGTCTTTGISKGTSAAFNQGTTDSITILNASAGADDIGDWTLQGVAISQKIPAQQPAASDYNIDLTLSVVAS